jgi:hypothetical protein
MWYMFWIYQERKRNGSAIIKHIIDEHEGVYGEKAKEDR